MYVLLYVRSLLHVSARTAPSSGKTIVTCLKLFAYCYFVTLVSNYKLYFIWVLQCYLQLLEQYLALCDVISYLKC